MMNFRYGGRICAAATLAVAVSGCYSGADGSVFGSGTDGVGGSASMGGPTAGETDGETEGGSDSNNDSDGPVNTDELPAPTTRFFRLTHAQWENTVVDLFYLDEWTGFSSNFRADPLTGGYLFSNSATSLEVDQALWGGYQRAAADVAAMITADQALLAAVLPIDGGDDAARGEAFVREFGRRAFRRPLSEEEVVSYNARFAGASDLYEEVDGFDAGVRLIIETMLQSPNFLYRVEASEEADGDVIALSSFEVASRMSYFFWDSMPDDDLLDLAEDDALTSNAMIEEQARRMLDDPRASDVIESFHDTVFEGEKMENAAPSASIFPNVPETFGELARDEFHHFVDDVVLSRDGGIRELLTSSRAFVNADLATIYGIEGTFGTELEPVELDGSQRRGILTQIGFLAANASSVNPDPIHRGKFLAERIVCAELPAPPDVIPPLPDVSGETNRESIEQLTEQPGSSCAGCHSTLINPYGFPFENYDAVGGWRVQDDGFDVDASATITLDGVEHNVGNALELIDVLAASPSVHSCYLQHWVEFAAGRPAAPEDDPLVTRLGTLSADDDTSVKDLLVALVTSQPFLTRSTEEL